jgi:hypothetical protein
MAAAKRGGDRVAVLRNRPLGAAGSSTISTRSFGQRPVDCVFELSYPVGGTSNRAL